MTQPNLLIAMIRLRQDEIVRRAARLGPQLQALHEHPAADSFDVVTVRFAGAADAGHLARLAELDSAQVPDGSLLIGERDGQPIAALSLSDGASVANPFVPSADVVALLRLRAAQLRRGDRPPGRGFRWRLPRAAAALRLR